MHPLVSGVSIGVLLTSALWALLWMTLLRRPTADAPELAPRAEGGPAQVPAGVSAVLGILRSGALVVDDTGAVLLTSGVASALDLGRSGHLVQGELRNLVLQVQQDGTVRESEVELARGPVGSARLVLSVRAGRIGEGLTLALVEDRTAAHRVEEVRRDFVVNVSHELKTPVGGLALLAEAVEDAADDPVAVTRFAGRMKTETTRLTRLVSEIVDLSRLQASDLLSDMVVVDVAACAAEAVDHTRLVAGAREVLSVSTGPTEQMLVHGDPELLTTAIRNLVANAIAYSEDGTRVSVVTRRVQDFVEVAVTDQGRGISPTNQERIFERFYRVDTARSRDTGGTGLGLSIVKHICANHGGEVTVWSQEGQGSTFTIRLPAAARPGAVGSAAPTGPGLVSQVADPAHGDAVPAAALPTHTVPDEKVSS